MINIKDKMQLELPGLETWRSCYSDKKCAMLMKSWAGVFRDCVLPKLPVNKIKSFYSGGMGRPTKELYSVMGAAVLQQFFNLTDEETIDKLAFDQQWHFALDCFNEEDQVISLKTLWTMRNQMVSSEIGPETFKTATDHLIKSFNINTDKQRLDSVHVYSNMAKLGRIGILSKTTMIFLKSLRKEFADLYEKEISQEIKDLYFKDKTKSVFGQIKPSESEKTLQNLAETMNALLLKFSDNNEITSLKAFRLMERVFSEQCEVKEAIVIVKKSKEIECNSVQNPSDEDAGYDGHKGQGYQTQIAETYSDECDKNDPDKCDINLITYIKTESAAIHDSHALIPAIEDLEDRAIRPEMMLCDAAYGSKKNITAGSENGVEVVSPVPGNTSKRGLENFQFDEETLKVTSCPAGKKPDQLNMGKNNRYCAKWSNSTCNKCPLGDDCPAQKSLKNRVLYYRKTEAYTLLRKIREQTDEFKDKYRYRSGIEGTNSRIVLQTEARRSRYRGLGKMSYSQSLKALFINVHRVSKSKAWVGICRTLLILLTEMCFLLAENRKLSKKAIIFA